MTKLGFDGKYKTLKMDSVEASLQFPDGFFDVIFIDADHDYIPFNRDLNAWIPKLKFGGTLCGHDYPGWVGVAKTLPERFGLRFTPRHDEVWEIIL
jgi:hypothetical protein